MRMISHLILVVAVCAMPSGLVFAETGPQEPWYPIFENNRWGLIDASGKVVLEPRFERVAKYPSFPGDFLRLPSQVAVAAEISSANPVTGSVIPIRLDGKAGLATRDGKVLALGRYEEMDWHFAEGRIKVKSAGLYGFADERGELIIPAKYHDVYPFKDGFAFVKVENRWGIIDREGQTIISPTWDAVDSMGAYSYKWITVRIGNRKGVVDRSGKIILPIRFEEITNPTEPLISVVESGRPMYVRPGGEVAFEIKCPKKLFRTPKGRGYPYFGKKSAHVVCGDIGEGSEGLIDTQGNFLLEPTWDGIGPFEEGRAVVSKGNRQGLIDEEGHFILEPGKFKYCGISEGMVCFEEPGSSKAGFLDLDGRVVIPPSLDWVLCFQEGLAVAGMHEKNPFGRGYIDRTGKWVIPPSFWRANSFNGPLATVEQPVSKDTKEVAYINRSGEPVYRMRFKGFVFPFMK